MIIKKRRAHFLAHLRQTLRELESIAAFIVRGISRAGDIATALGKGRLNGNDFVGIDHPAIAAVFPHQFGDRNGGVEFPAVAIEMQDALAALVVTQAFIRPYFLNETAAFHRQLDDCRGMLCGAVRQAVDHEFRNPKPLMNVHARPEQQRRVAPKQPLEDFKWRRWIGPRLGMAHRNLATIGEAGFEPRLRLAVNDADGFAGAQIPVSATDADNTGAQYNDVKLFGCGIRGIREHVQALQ